MDELLAKKIEELKRVLAHSRRAVFFGGAGVSTESGVPDFRSKDGLYNNRGVRFEGFSPEYLLSRDCLEREPEVFFEFYRQKLDARAVRPNKAHFALAKLEREGRLSGVVTQNIDGLHQLAGSRRVWEIHGTTKRNYCMRCRKPYPADFIFDCKEPIPRCSCGGIVRCDVTLYGEALPEDAVRGAVEAINEADTLIIGGTSLTVYPAASYIDYFAGENLVIVNKQPLGRFSAGAQTLEINAPIGEVLGEATK